MLALIVEVTFLRGSLSISNSQTSLSVADVYR